MLKFKTKKVIDCSDWDKLVTNTYNKPYCFQQQDGCQSRGLVNITIPDDNKYEAYMRGLFSRKFNRCKVFCSFLWEGKNIFNK